MCDVFRALINSLVPRSRKCTSVFFFFFYKRTSFLCLRVCFVVVCFSWFALPAEVLFFFRGAAMLGLSLARDVIITDLCHACRLCLRRHEPGPNRT